MPSQSNADPASAMEELVTFTAADFKIAAPGSDDGLLAIYSMAMELDRLSGAANVPVPIVAACRRLLTWLDALLDTTAKFNEQGIARITEWRGWFTAAIGKWRAGEPVPKIPDSWVDKEASGADVTSVEPLLVLNPGADHELLAEFIHESQEHLENIEQGILILEANPFDADTLNSIFRAFHTFKGGAGFLNLGAIKNLAHELESLLDAARQHRLKVTSPIIEVILAGQDCLTDFVTQITARLASSNPSEPICVPTVGLISQVQAILAVPEGGEKLQAAEILPITPPAQAVDPIELLSIPVREKPVRNAPAPAPNGQAAAPAQLTEAVKAGAVKVDTQKLDSLIEIVGELVIAQSMVIEDPGVRALLSQNLTRNLAQLRRTTYDLQRTAMSMRMVPIRGTFQKMNRVVRDLAARQGKQVRLTLAGEETELDRTIVGELSDPLLHMIRNSVDHGIEKTADRKARGKDAEGHIVLSAFHKGGNIVIEIRDDGNGLNADRILAKAIEKGIVSKEAQLSDQEIFALIFNAGFSTVEEVTDISGRGVGMDVVRKNIEKLRGSIAIDSAPGKGSVFTISLPLTLAIIDGLIVAVGPERYIIPTLSVRESFRPTAEMISTLRGREEMISVRGKLTPLLRLHQYFNIPTAITDPSQAILVVVESGAGSRCLLVDQLLCKQEVVIKSLGSQFEQNRALAGGAILSDGLVGLILNVDALVSLRDESGIKMAA